MDQFNSMVALNNYVTQKGVNAEWKQGKDEKGFIMILTIPHPDGSGPVEVIGHASNLKEAKKAAAAEFFSTYVGDSACVEPPAKRAKTRKPETTATIAVGDAHHTHPKAILSTYCMRAGVKPEWNADTHGVHPAQCQRWTVTCTIPLQTPIVAQGTSASKKEAEIAAAEKVLAKLASIENVQQPAGASDPPAIKDLTKTKKSSASQVDPCLENGPEVVQSDATHSEVGESVPPDDTFGYTIANSKLALIQYLQRKRLPADIPTGPGVTKSFHAMLQIELPGGVLQHRCESSKKTQAQNLVAVCMCADLVTLGEMPPFQSKQQVLAEGITPITMTLSPEIEEQMDQLLGELSIEDVTAVWPEPQPGQSVLLDFDAEPWATLPDAKDISWSAPVWGRNPWKGDKVDGCEDQVDAGLKLQVEQEHKSNMPAYQSTFKKRQELPISFMREEILDAIEASPVTLISGSTGCGKTTQLPQMLLERAISRGEATGVNVLCTQPRRIAAITVAERVAMERGEQVGQSVGYHVRFSSILPRGYASVCYMTTGMLLRWMTTNGLRGVSHLLVDEVHERDLDSDFLLTIIKQLVHVAPGLRVILMSATIDTDKWSSYFGQGFGTTLEIPGRLFPVDVHYLEDVVRMVGPALTGKPDDEILVELIERLMTRLVMESCRKKRGAILVFLPGWETINTLNKKLTRSPQISKMIRVHLLHSQVPKEEQQQAFHAAPPPLVKVILSTNIAESSVTISDVVYVVDACQQKQLIPVPSAGGRTAYRLTNTPASKQNLIQRAGRAGRVQQGVCYRLISRWNFERLELSHQPEMTRMPLHQVTLMLKALNLGDAAPFLAQAPDPPTPQAVEKAILVLQDLKALDSGERITDLGVKLARLPVEPRMAFALLASCMLGLAEPMAILGAVASSPPIHLKPMGPGTKPVTTQEFSQHLLSDHHDALMMCYEVWSKPPHMAKSFCWQHWLDEKVIAKVTEAKEQTLRILTGMGFGAEAVAPCQGWISTLGTADETEDARKLWAMLTFLLSFGLEHFAVRRQGTRKVWVGPTKQSSVQASPGIPEVPNMDMSRPFFIFAELRENEWNSSCRVVTASGAAAVILGAARDLIYSAETGCLLVDGWAPVRLSYRSAARLSAMRAALRVCMLHIAKAGYGTGAEGDWVVTAFQALLSELCMPVEQSLGALTAMSSAGELS